ncbi:MAG: Tn3 family transposase [Alphaproteobacteria bacterium]|nr:Tn3 family transposase [Alphaproteobacteria bacterium]
MKRLWSVEELVEHWSLGDGDADLLAGKHASGRLRFAAQIAFYRFHGRFPNRLDELAPAVIAHLADQIGMAGATLDDYDWTRRTGRRHRREILEALGVRPFDGAAEVAFREWLLDEVMPMAPTATSLEERILGWLATAKVERPAAYRLDRLIRSARQAHETHVFQTLARQLDPATRHRLDALLTEPEDGEPTFLHLRADPGRVGLESLLTEIEKLKRIRDLGLPAGILGSFHPDLVKRLRRRAATESPWELRRHPDGIRLPLLVFYCVPREAEIVDGLIELLLQVTHRITVRAERRIVEDLLEDVQQVHGKTRILFRIAAAALENPDGAVRDVIFPVADEAICQNLVREQGSGGTGRTRQVHTLIRASYASHYRRMLPKLLDALEFRSNNAIHRPLLDAIDTLRRGQECAGQYYALNEIAVDGVIRPKWRGVVIEEALDGKQRVNRINYEICVLQSLRDRLRCKEIWVVGADRFRNPDQDLPGDYAQRREACYARLGLPLDPDAFIDRLRSEMESELGALHRELPDNPTVRLDPRRKHPIIVTPLDPQPTPPTLEALKLELGRRWPMTGLLDILKEADLRTGFTGAFVTAAQREAVDRIEVQRRLLLCLYGLGTNAGLKRLSGGSHGASYKELLHTRRRYIDKESLRDATRRVVDATLAVRRTDLWGEGTAACAADSKKFGAWDQNLMTEWHIRYGGRGVMIYWHVERKSTCIYSQLKRCSSSEVAAMIEGVLRHDTAMAVERQYVDSHGQSEVAFAFCRLLGFTLLPRLKAISSQRLYLPAARMGEEYVNLAAILTRPIDWGLVRTQYDEMVRYATALQERTADPEAILRRFTRSSVQHPTYRALAELGKAAKTIFLCRYLGSEALRREIHEGLNVVENWNSANSFIFFGKGGEVATNRLEDQEVSVLALHLLQSCLVYINTLMLQRVLDEPAWRGRMTEADLRGLCPLVYGHVSPYGTFELDLERRMDLDMPMAA